MKTFPELHSERLLLSEITSQDIPQIVAHADNPNVAHGTLSIPHPYTHHDAVSFIIKIHQQFHDGLSFTWGIRLKDNPELIGVTGLHLNNTHNHAEIGYWLAEPFWNQGYTTEAIGKLLDYGFSHLNLNKIFAHHFKENPASGKVMTKNGMIKEAELVEHVKKDGKYLTVIQYRLTQSEYKKLTKSSSRLGKK